MARNCSEPCRIRGPNDAEDDQPSRKQSEQLAEDKLFSAYRMMILIIYATSCEIYGA